jgi:hypothetical protein
MLPEAGVNGASDVDGSRIRRHDHHTIVRRVTLRVSWVLEVLRELRLGGGSNAWVDGHAWVVAWEVMVHALLRRMTHHRRGSMRLGSILLGSIWLGSIWLGSIWLGSILLGSVRRLRRSRVVRMRIGRARHRSAHLVRVHCLWRLRRMSGRRRSDGLRLLVHLSHGHRLVIVSSSGSSHRRLLTGRRWGRRWHDRWRGRSWLRGWRILGGVVRG